MKTTTFSEFVRDHTDLPEDQWEREPLCIITGQRQWIFVPLPESIEPALNYPTKAELARRYAEDPDTDLLNAAARESQLASHALAASVLASHS